MSDVLSWAFLSCPAMSRVLPSSVQLGPLSLPLPYENKESFYNHVNRQTAFYYSIFYFYMEVVLSTMLLRNASDTIFLQL